MRSIYYSVGLIFFLLLSSAFSNSIFLRTHTLKSSETHNRFSEIFERVPFIIEVKGPVTLELKEYLRSEGLEILRYIPENAFIVKTDSYNVIKNIFYIDAITGVFPYRPEYKYFKIGDNEIYSYRVIFFDGKKINLEADSYLLSKISENPEVEFIERYNPPVPFILDLGWDTGEDIFRSFTFNSPPDGSENGVRITGVEKVYDKYGYIGEDEIVGVVDSGLDIGTTDGKIHSDFENSVRCGFNVSVHSKNNAGDWSDPVGHGTHVAGLIAGRGIASDGNLKGVAYGAKIVVASFWSYVLNSMRISNDFDKIFNLVYSRGARILSNSWGGGLTAGLYDLTARDIDKIAWKKKDILFVFAAGNTARDGDADGKVDSGSISSPGLVRRRNGRQSLFQRIKYRII